MSNKYGTPKEIRERLAGFMRVALELYCGNDGDFTTAERAVIARAVAKTTEREFRKLCDDVEAEQ